MKSLYRIFVLMSFVLGLCIVAASCGTDDEPGRPSTPSNPSGDTIAVEPQSVDLGLSVNWATFNVGAVTPSDYGDYFAWGEIKPKQVYNTHNSIFYGRESDDISGDKTRDVAAAEWGGGWRMPTANEIRELIEKCDWTSATECGVSGYKVTGPSGKSIFLPSAGYFAGQTCDKRHSGFYWSSTPLDGGLYDSNLLKVDVSGANMVEMVRANGCSVRPVHPKSNSGNNNGGNDTGGDEGGNEGVDNNSPETGDSIINHVSVDLGMSVKWAECNVGADSPEDFGDYFSWGELTTKNTYIKSNSATNGVTLEDIGSNPIYDVARAQWGGSWRLPTKTELEELKETCDWTWTTLNGVAGYEVKSRINGNTIFLPAAGYFSERTNQGRGSDGFYWSSTPDEFFTNFAYFLNFYNRNVGIGYTYRYYGISVRPVSD